MFVLRIQTNRSVTWHLQRQTSQKGITGTIPVANGGTGLTSGTTGQFLKFTGTTTVASAAVVEGLEEADGWQVTSGFSGSAEPITSNWARNDLRSTGGKVGTGWTQSSGVFSAPSTGLYYITFIRNYYNNANAANVHANIAITSDNGSNWYTVTNSYGNTYNNGQDPSGNAHSHSTSNIYFNVTNVSTHKVRFHATHYGSIGGSLDWLVVQILMVLM